MIIDLPDTTVSAISKKLVSVREEGGAVALGRVLTLIIVTHHGADPMRVIAVLFGDDDEEPRLDAQIRVGGDAGASEVVVLRAHGAAGSNAESLVTGLLLPDAPVVAWWPADAPVNPSKSAIGRIAQRRITDASSQEDPAAWVARLGEHYAPGDTDFAWTRLTRWREQLGLKLEAPVDYAYLSPEEWATGIKSVRLTRASGDILLERPEPAVAVLTQPGQPTHDLAFPRRTLRECLAEELRRLDPDVLYGRVITECAHLLRTADERSDA
ncbi:MAG: opcA [Microbacterium sp.]|nr:opcA [Microbacterium sp.]